MGILADQRFRLLREEWDNPLDLAQELYAMFGADGPLQIDGPVQIKNNTDAPAVSIDSAGVDGGGADVFNITRGRDPDVAFSDVLPGVSTPAAAAAGGGSGGGGVPCKVVSGTGSTYVVTLYPNGVTAGGNVTATQLQIASDETIPPDSWGFAVLVGGRYFIQFPVWM